MDNFKTFLKTVCAFLVATFIVILSVLVVCNFAGTFADAVLMAIFILVISFGFGLVVYFNNSKP